jgi:type III secretion control protein HpaP
MTRIRSPRELRIVVAQPPAAGTRFGQLLDQARQALDPPDRGAPAGDDGARDDGDEAGQERHGGDGHAPDRVGALPPPPRPRVPGAARDDSTRAIGARLVAHCARAAEAELVADHLAERIARFCTSPALEHAGGRWEVVVELDPAILPHTRLHLLLSDGTLALRFDARDARARQLICDHGSALRSRLEAHLEARPGARITVHVEVN